MATDILFRCEENQDDFIRVSAIDGQIVIESSFYDSEIGQTYPIIYFDKPTAIRFAKTLRTEINKIDNHG